MADEVLYLRPGEKHRYAYDFTPKLGDTDTAINSSTSTVTATDEEDQDASSAVVGTVSKSGLILTADLIGATHGKDYLAVFRGVGNTSSLPRDWTVEIRCRKNIVGAL